jgi:DnaK suppressor protein
MSLTRKNKERFRKTLVEMRRGLIDQVKAQNQSTREKDYIGDLGDCATTDLAAEYAYLFSDRLRKRLQLIDEALEAIESGEYGLCEDCEEPINEKRLLLLPFTRWCVRCQSERERQAKMRGATLVDLDLSDFQFSSQDETEES